MTNSPFHEGIQATTYFSCEKSPIDIELPVFPNMPSLRPHEAELIPLLTTEQVGEGGEKEMNIFSKSSHLWPLCWVTSTFPIRPDSPWLPLWNALVRGFSPFGPTVH